MANYSLVANSTFQPFSYQELAAPLDRQELYQEKLAEEYDKLSTQADVLEAMGQNDRDKRSGAYNRYKSYSDSLRKEADDLYRFGLNTESRQRLSDLRRMYNTEIVPIQNAWNKREEESKLQLEASMKNPSLMYTRDARNTTLDEYLRNPQGGFGVINGANITAQMAGMAKNLSKQIRNGNKQNIDEFTYNYIEKYGLDENLIRNWQDSPTLKAMFEQVMEANGVTPEALSQSANMQNIVNQSANYAQMGMWEAMGEDKSHIMENYEARLNAQAAKEISVARARASLERNGSNSNTTGTIAINPLNIYSAKEVEGMDDNIKKYKDYFTFHNDGSVTLNTRGVAAYKNPVISGGTSYSVTGASSSTSEEDSEFKKFVDSQLGADAGKAISSNDYRLYRTVGNAFKDYINRGSRYDATKTTEFDYTIDSSQQGDMKNAILTAARGTDLKEVDFDTNTNTFSPTGETLSLSKLNDNKYTVVSTRFSPYGNTVMIKDDDGEVHRYNMPSGINITNENNRNRAMQLAVELQKVITTGKYKDNNGIEHTLTVDELREAQNSYAQALQEAYMYHSQLGVANKTKEQEFNPYGY